MAEQTYAFANFIGISISADGIYQVTSSSTASSDPILENDGLLDGQTAATGDVIWFNSAYEFIGYTSDGDPVFQSIEPSALGFTYVASNSDLTGQTVTFESGGTYFYCFARDTRIATPDGAASIERLSVGDMILTADGRSVPVKWIGRQTVSTLFGPAERSMLVRVRAGALGGDLPKRDLTLTADHALLIDGLLINAGALVNGSSIDYVSLSELGASYTVYHIETENHDIILAEGTPAETFIDYVGRQAFDNYAEYVELYGDERLIHEMAYPRISSARLVPPALKARLAGAKAA